MVLTMVISQHENSFGVVPTDFVWLGNQPRNHRVFVRHFPLGRKSFVSAKNVFIDISSFTKRSG